MNRFLATACICIISFGCLIANEQENAASASLEIMYLANEGMFIRSGEKTVIIDGLFRGGVSRYMTLPDDLREELETASGEFNNCDLVLVTHLHSDHFDAASVYRHLLNNPMAQFVAGKDVAGLVETEAGDNFAKLQDRIHAPILQWKQDTTVALNDINITLLRTRHGWWKNYGLDHLGFVVELDGKRILHLGDIEMTEENLFQFKQHLINIDVAILPHWLMTYDKGIELTRRYIKAEKYIAVHVEPEKLTEITRNVLSSFPSAEIAGEARQRISY